MGRHLRRHLRVPPSEQGRREHIDSSRILEFVDQGDASLLFRYSI
jgi:hypothetical protein